MAQLLIMAVSNTHADPAKDLRGCYKRGMVVEVFEDDKVLTRPMSAPFVVVKITGVTRAQAEKYLQHETDGVDENGEPVITRRRMFHLAWDDMPNAVKRALRDNRYYETTWAQIRNYVRNIRTGAGE